MFFAQFFFFRTPHFRASQMFTRVNSCGNRSRLFGSRGSRRDGRLAQCWFVSRKVGSMLVYVQVSRRNVGLHSINRPISLKSSLYDAWWLLSIWKVLLSCTGVFYSIGEGG
uniref:Uncharacterized protein n=1 Tax=Pertusaria plittiana TaxID=394545 RepID=A0A2P1M540_9LECA|nr:hypothetical protein [Pertusaria plittiana]